MRIRSAVEAGALAEAIELVRRLDAQLLVREPLLSYQLEQQRFIELVRA